MKMNQITVYGAPWCPDCRRSKTFLMEQRIPFTWVDIDTDADGLRFVEDGLGLLADSRAEHARIDHVDVATQESLLSVSSNSPRETRRWSGPRPLWVRWPA
jgi:glutaredoxin-related protein